MKRLPALLLGVLCLGCTATVRTAPAPAPEPAPAPPPPAPAPVTTVAEPPPAAPASAPVSAWIPPAGHEHLLSCDDAWVCFMSRVVEPPSPALGGRGRFMWYRDNRQVVTEKWFIARPMAHGEALREGQPILFFAGNPRGGLEYPPADDRQSTQGAWVVGRVTSMAEFRLGVVITARHRVHHSAVRIITRAGTPRVRDDR